MCHASTIRKRITGVSFMAEITTLWHYSETRARTFGKPRFVCQITLKHESRITAAINIPQSGCETFQSDLDWHKLHQANKRL